jgi:hypothetical protein
MILADVANTHPGRYVMGSWKRSNIIAGYGSPGNVSGVNLAPGAYFGVNLAVEAPDRLENYTMADMRHLTSNPQGYEYYSMGEILFRYNPFVIERVRALSHPGQDYLKNQAQDLCFIYPNIPCGNTPNFQSYSHLEPVEDLSNAYYGFGWVGMYRAIAEDFIYYASTTTIGYQTDAGGVINIAPGAHVCRECGQKGFAKINRAFLGATVTANNTSASKPAFVPDGVDAEPENTWMVFHFFVKSNAVAGMASEIRASSFATYTQFQFAIHTSQTSLIPGGPLMAIDWDFYCYPFDLSGGAIQYCSTPLGWSSSLVIFQGLERMNPNILPSGEAVTGNSGGVQTWSTYVCVQ